MSGTHPAATEDPPSVAEATSGASEINDAFRRSVDLGAERLSRTWPGLIATGLVGGIDVSIGVFGFLIVMQATGNQLLASLAFGIGFVALTLANSELFTENFLVPVSAVVTGHGGPLSLLRQWITTLAANLVGGWVTMAVILTGFPSLRDAALEVGTRSVSLGIGTQAFASAIVAGLVITLMTWMERSTDSVPAKLIAAVSCAFLLAAAPLEHAVVISLESFGALQVGAPFGYGDWARMLGLASVGNMVGGIALVTLLRLVQVGRFQLVRERQNATSTHER
jgi:formate/nitrite transporter FocA (FNT family)